MAMGAASIGLLMMVSLEALLLLVFAGTLAAAVSGGTIRLPSDARGAQVEESRYVCDDKYMGDPGPRCHENGNGRGGGGPERMAVLRGARNKGQKRPWKCCDKAVPGPTTQGTVWYCMDKVERCTCDRCYKLKDSHCYYYCLDGYQGSDPGPTCSHA